MTMAREMRGERHARREHEPLDGDAARGGLTPQVPHRHGVALEQPQDAAVDRRQQPHPDVEDRRQDLEAVVEAAEDEARPPAGRLRSAPASPPAIALVESLG